MNRLGPLAALICSVMVGACASPWEANFIEESWGSSSRGPAAALNQDVPVQVRSVPWERMQGTLRELERDVTLSDVSPPDWSAAKVSEEKTKLLRGLQVSEDPATVEVVGRSEFVTTDLLRPDGDGLAELEGVARRVGATKVVWSRSVLGRTDTIVHEPITSHSYHTGYVRDRGGRVRPVTFSGSSTTWVPVTVQANEYGYVAFFLR